MPRYFNFDQLKLTLFGPAPLNSRPIDPDRNYRECYPIYFLLIAPSELYAFNALITEESYHDTILLRHLEQIVFRITTEFAAASPDQKQAMKFSEWRPPSPEARPHPSLWACQDAIAEIEENLGCLIEDDDEKKRYRKKNVDPSYHNLAEKMDADPDFLGKCLSVGEGGSITAKLVETAEELFYNALVYRICAELFLHYYLYNGPDESPVMKDLCILMHAASEISFNPMERTILTPRQERELAWQELRRTDQKTLKHENHEVELNFLYGYLRAKFVMVVGRLKYYVNEKREAPAELILHYVNLIRAVDHMGYFALCKFFVDPQYDDHKDHLKEWPRYKKNLLSENEEKNWRKYIAGVSDEIAPLIDPAQPFSLQC